MAATMSSVSRSSSSGGIADARATWGAFGAAPSGGVARVTVMRPSREQGLGLLQGLGQLIDFFGRVVEADRGAAGRGRAEALEQRHGAMGAGPDGDALAVDHGRNVAGVRALHLEGDDAALAPGP